MKYIILIIMVIFLAGCGVDYKEIEKAECLCKNNGGVRYISDNMFEGHTVFCNNGAKFNRYHNRKCLPKSRD